MSSRIDVVPAQARSANAIATQASVPAAPLITAAPTAVSGMFSFVAGTLLTKSANATAAAAALTARLEVADERSAEAVESYVVTDEENRRSLSVVPEV